MTGSTSLATHERRRHPRRACEVPVTLLPAGGAPLACESVDLSVGGVRLRRNGRIPVGPVLVVIDDTLSVEANVVEELIDATTGEVTARVVFAIETPALAGATPAARRSRRRQIAAALLAAATIGVVGLTLDGDEDAPAPVTASSAIADGQERPIDRVPAAPMTTAPPAAVEPAFAPVTEAPIASVVPAPSPGHARAPEAIAPPAVEPAPPARVAVTEHADNQVTVHVGNEPSEHAASSTAGPSAGVDRVRIELGVAPGDAQGAFPVWVRIENRHEEAITFDGGLVLAVDATRDGASVHSIELRRDDVLQLAPGESVMVEGTLVLTEPGDHAVSVTTDLSAPAEA